MKFSKRIEGIFSSPIRRLTPYADGARDRGLEVISLNIGQPDIETPEVFYQAVKDFDRNVLEYTDSRGTKDARESTQAYLNSHGADFKADEILITNGASEGLLFTLMAVLDEGDEVINIEPFYPNYDTFVKMAGGVIKGVMSSIEDGFAMPSREDFEKVISEKTKAIMISSPSNPTGRVYRKEELDIIADLARDYDLFILADEVYREFNYTDRDFYSFTEYEDLTDRVVLLDSISKKYSACGARVGSIACKNKDLIGHILKLCQARLSVSTLDQVGAGALDRIDPSYIRESLAQYESRKRVLSQRLAGIKNIKFTQPEGAFYTIVDLPVENSEDFIIWVLENISLEGYTLIMTPADSFYTDPSRGRKQVRISYCVNEDLINRAMDILELALDTYKK